MKELSIEEKAKAYDSMFERLQEMYENNKTNVAYRLIYERYFPELKESEDERIRKLLLESFKSLSNACTKNNCYRDDITYKDVIAWLEKQGEHANFRNKIQVGDKVTRNEDGVLVNLSQLKRIAKKDEKQSKNDMGISEATKKKLEDNLNKALEKETPESWNKFLDEQGEQRPNPCNGCVNRKGCINCEDGELRETEQKIANSEPKFHEGDWLVNLKHGNVVRVLEILEYNYRLDYGVDTIGTLCTELVDNDYRLWSIGDAKDGDVLFTSSTASHETFIFKSIDERGNVECYFAYDSEDGFREGKYHFIGSAINCKPATKKQYDTLMKAMTDAGYTFDFEKKELKKIDKENLTEFEIAVKNVMEEAIEDGDTHNLKADAENLLRIAQPTWSEEDTRLLDNCISLIEDIDCTKEEQMFLKSLKERFGYEANCTTTKEWSEEDEDILNTIINHFKVDIECTDEDDIIKWLKSLKERVQPKQEWSKEDIATISRVISIVKWAAYSDHSHPILNDEGATELIERLKSLKERYTWKPSDEQLKLLKKVIDAGYYTSYPYALETLYEQLRQF